MMDWQPIATAPKDDTPILGSDGKTQFTISYSVDWHIMCEGYDSEYVIAIEKAYPECALEALYSPTHWMPLPEPPKQRRDMMLIENEEQHKNYLLVAEVLISLDPHPDTKEGVFLNYIASIISKYEGGL